MTWNIAELRITGSHTGPDGSKPAATAVRRLALALVLAAGSSAHAGTVMESETRDLTHTEAQAPRAIKTYAQSGRMRIETGDGVMLFKDDAIYHIDPKDKTYTVMDRAAMQRIGEQLNPALKQLQEQMAKMPPEQRAQIEKMMGQQAPGASKSQPQQVRKTGRTGKIASYACSYAEILADGAVVGEACVAAPNTLQGADELMAAAKKMSALVQEMVSAVDAPWLRQMANDQTANFEKLGGVPVLLRQLEAGKPVHEMQLKSIRSESLAASLFETPAGFTRKEMMPAR